MVRIDVAHQLLCMNVQRWRCVAQRLSRTDSSGVSRAPQSG
jgi:hypothetical protein